MASKMITRTFPSRETLDVQLAADVAAALAGAAADRGRGILVVSGGSTPVHFFQRLSMLEIPWSRITITLADERWVPPDNNASNEKLVRENLLLNAAAEARFIPLKNSAENAIDGQPELEKVLSQLGTIDVLVLGMGGDGHTASLFPGATALEQGMNPASEKKCLAIDPVTAPHQRMSMTLPRLLDARQIIIHITGVEKKAVLEKALTTTDQKQLPISAIVQQQATPVTLYWAK